MRYPPYLEDPDFPFPPLLEVEMDFPRSTISDVTAAVFDAMEAALPKSGILPGQTVGVAVGSRGMGDLPQMVKAVCLALSTAGARPVIVPAMGSHGGATGEGQRRVLAHLGVHEAAWGARVVSSMAATRVGTVLGEVPVYFSEDLLKMDHCICVNRIKPHSKFKGPVQSGISKMLCVGMGKHEGALSFHRWALKHGFSRVLAAMAKEAGEKTNFRFGLAVVEDAFGRPAKIAPVFPGSLAEDEAALLTRANQMMPRLPVREVDFLVVQNVGKDVSGAGMDPNITGRAYDLMEDDFSSDFSATRVALLNLTKKTAGNAIGMGNADFITEKIFAALDYEATVMNALTSVSVRKAFVPVRLAHDRMAVTACFTTIGPVPPNQVKGIVIKDTKRLFTFWATEALRPQLAGAPNAKIKDRPRRFCFDETGEMSIEPV